MTDQELLHLHDQGMTMAALARLIGCSAGLVSQRIMRATPPRAELLDALARWGADGVAEEYEVSLSTVDRWRSMYAPARAL